MRNIKQLNGVVALSYEHRLVQEVEKCKQGDKDGEQ